MRGMLWFVLLTACSSGEKNAAPEPGVRPDEVVFGGNVPPLREELWEFLEPHPKP